MVSRDNFAQGTIEYLVVLAVVVVISLIVVALVVGVSSSPSQQIIDSSSKVGEVAVGGISIVESVVDPEGDSLIFLSNNSSDAITLKKISVGGLDNNYDNILSGLDSKGFSLSGLASACPCVSGQKSVKCEFKIEYLTVSGLTKTEYRTVNVRCVDDSTASDDDKIIDPIIDGALELCGSIESLPNYTPIDECSDISEGGNYLFTQNMTCNITLSFDDVNINGNYCTLTGNISGNNSSDGGEGYSFNIFNLTADAVSSTGGDASSEYGNAGVGGSITLTNSTVDYIISNGGSTGLQGVGGTGGTILLTDSNTNSISSIGGIGFGGGDGGIVILSNSRVIDEVNVSGGGSTEPGAGNGGSITSTNNSLIGLAVSNGGPNDSSGGVGGSGGTISLTDSTVSATISAIGGVGSGSGGNIILSNVSGISAIVDAINVKGADISSVGQQGGTGGDVNFLNPVFCPAHLAVIEGSINISGGSGTIQGDVGSVDPEGCGQYD